MVSTQTISGTGSIRLLAEFIHKFRTNKTIHVCMPTWTNHFGIFDSVGLETETYRYLNRKTLRLDFEGMVEDIEEAEEGANVLFHTCGHNPTGNDPT